MVGSDELPEVQGDVGDLVAEQPAQIEEGRGIADDLLGLVHGAHPVGLLVGRRVAPRGTRVQIPPETDGANGQQVRFAQE